MCTSSRYPFTRICAILALFMGLLLEMSPKLHAQSSTESPQPRIVSATVRVDGLTCSLCHRSVYKALKGLNFVEKLAPNLDETSLDITFTKNNTVSFDRIAEAIQDAGFSVGILKASVDFPPMVVHNDDHIPLGGALLHVVNVAGERSIQGRVEMKLIDANFIPQEEATDWRTKVHHSCYKTGTVEECCGQDASITRTKPATRVYHCTL
jgi:copper chaperone CopZ